MKLIMFTETAESSNPFYCILVLLIIVHCDCDWKIRSVSRKPSQIFVLTREKREKKKERVIVWCSVESSLVSRLDLWQLKETLQRWKMTMTTMKAKGQHTLFISLCSHLPALPSFFPPLYFIIHFIMPHIHAWPLVWFFFFFWEG